MRPATVLPGKDSVSRANSVSGVNIVPQVNNRIDRWT